MNILAFRMAPITSPNQDITASNITESKGLEPPAAGSIGGVSSPWSKAIEQATKGLGKDLSAQATVKSFSELMKVQLDVNRYQLRVEMLSKLSESAMTTVRKIQQNN